MKGWGVGWSQQETGSGLEPAGDGEWAGASRRRGVGWSQQATPLERPAEPPAAATPPRVSLRFRTCTCLRTLSRHMNWTTLLRRCSEAETRSAPGTPRTDRTAPGRTSVCTSFPYRPWALLLLLCTPAPCTPGPARPSCSSPAAPCTLCPSCPRLTASAGVGRGGAATSGAGPPGSDRL